MGKRLIIKGADFSQVAIPSSSITWLNTYEEPNANKNLCIAGTSNNVFGFIFPAGTKVSVLKCYIITDATGSANVKQMSAGSKLNIYTVNYSDTTYVSKTKVGEFELTAQDISNGYKVVTFNEVTLSANQFVGIGFSDDTVYDEGGNYLPVSREQDAGGVTLHYCNASGTTIYIENHSKGLAFGYITEE